MEDFFQSILGINLSVILLSPTECLIFSGNHNQAMSWDESLRYSHQLLGVHPWTLQETLKEARHEMQVAREFTHERTKQRVAHLNALAAAPPKRTQPATPQRSPLGHGMTRQADQFFMPCWALDWRLQRMNDLTPPARMPKRMRVTPRAWWTLSLMPAWVRKRMPQGAQLIRPQLIGAATGIAP